MDGPSLFDTRDLWKPSVFAHDIDSDRSLFPDLENETLPFLPPLEEHQALFDIQTDTFALPLPRDDHDDALIPEEPVNVPLSDEAALDHSESPDFNDVWDVDFEALPEAPSGSTLHTWEAFHLKDHQSQPPKYLSEAGNAAYDAVLQRLEETVGVLPQSVVLRACCNLVLGRSSVFFQWSLDDRSFRRTLERVPMSGMSIMCSDSTLTRLMEYGAAFRRLAAYSNAVSQSDCPALVAFRHCVTSALEGTEHHVSLHVRAVRSLLQLQSVTDGPSRVLEMLESLVRDIGKPKDDEEVISLLADSVIAHADSGSPLTAFLQQILLRISAPWLQNLAGEVGLSQEASTWQRSCMKAEDPSHGPNAAHSERPRFIAIEDWRLLEDTRRGIRVLAQHLPGHELLTTQARISSARSEVPLSQHTRALSVRNEVSMLETYDDSSATQAEVDLSCETFAPENTLTTSANAFDVPPLDDLAFDTTDRSGQLVEGNEYNSLQETFRGFLVAPTDALPRAIAEDASDLLAPVRTNLEQWSRSVNAAVLSCVFEDCKLRDHFELHRSFHLFGSGEFVTRLTTALFSDHTQPAERKRGNIPTGQTMGLRLESREGQRWPPASSELRLTLLGVLSDAYYGNATNEQLPGGLSFAIRELSDAEIDKVMDATSIHALDFLRLQYTPPGPLAEVFTPEVVQKYDSIFRTLLIHLRVLYTTQQLSWHCSWRNSNDDSDSARRFAWKARHLVTALSSHTMDVAIDESWRHFQNDLAALDPMESTSPRKADHGPTVAGAGISDLARLHIKCLEDIRSSMFLRRKHAGIRTAIEDSLDAILKGAASVMHGSASSASCAQHESRLEEAKARLIRFVADIARKPGKDANAQRESDMAKLLLKRLAPDADGIEDVEGT